MKIAFLSSLNPDDIHNWSGTLYYIFHSLKQTHDVEWVGKEVQNEVFLFHQFHFGTSAPFVPEANALLFGKLLSDWFKAGKYDVIFARDYYFIAYLKADIPVIYIGDTTFRLFNEYLKRKDDSFVRLADEIERRAISRADRLIYSSEWAKQSAIQHYGADPGKIQVIEFGANMDTVPPGEYPSPAEEVCHLLFAGKNWVYKGGPKALETYRILKEKRMKCSLTIIGSKPEISGPPDPDLKIIPFLDKSDEADREQLYRILCQTHFLILPTVFDCFGIVFCEASAFSIPSLTTDTGGVSQVVKEGKNGFLFPEDAGAREYADRIQAAFEDKIGYRKLRHSSRTAYEERLNWTTWTQKVNSLLSDIAEDIDFYIPTYVIHMKEREDRKQHILKEFEGKDEFELNFIEACKDPVGAVGLWKSIVKVIRLAREKEEDVIIICEDDHFFTEYYSKEMLFQNITEAYHQHADVLSGGIGGFGTAVPVGKNRYWVDWFWCTQFIVVYSKFFERILNYSFGEQDTADGVISALANPMALYPFISRQKDFGYSDVTPSNNEQTGMITRHFAAADQRLAVIHRVADYFVYHDPKR